MVASLQAHVRRLFFHNSIVLTTYSIEQHATIIECLKKRDAARVSQLMRDNWLRAIEEFYTREKDSNDNGS